MLKIETCTSNGTEMIVALTGWLRREHLPELERVVTQPPAAGRHLCLDLTNVSLVDREAVQFLAAGPGRSLTLRACPTYLRTWLEALGRDTE